MPDIRQSNMMEYQPLNYDRQVSTTAGERLFNEFTYRGIDFGLNALVGVSFAYWSGRTESGQRFFGKPVEWFFNKTLSPIIKNEAHLAKSVGVGRTFLSIMAGGTAIIPPIMYLEGHKRQIVEYLDRRIYGDEKVDSQDRFAIAYHAIENEPHKGFGVGMGARLLALAPIFGTALGAPDTCKDILYNPISKVSMGIADKLGIEGAALKAKTYETAGGELSNHWNYIHETIGMDVGLTFFYSYLHEYSYNLLSALGYKGQEKPQKELPSPQVMSNSIALHRMIQSQHGAGIVS